MRLNFLDYFSHKKRNTLIMFYSNFRFYLAVILPLLVSSFNVKIGIIGGPEDSDWPQQNNERFWSLGQNYSSPISLEPKVRITRWWDSLDITRGVCDLVQEGVSSLVFLGPMHMNSLLASYSQNLGLPLITALDNGEKLGKFQVSLLPDTSKAAAQLLKHYNWQRFAFIYDATNGGHQLQMILRAMDDTLPEVEAFWKAPDVDTAFRFIHTLPPNARRILLATSESLADELVSRLAGSRTNFHFILLRPVGAVQKTGNQGSAKLTKFSVVEPMEPLLQTIENRLKTLPSYHRPTVKNERLPDSILLSYDASLIFYNMFGQIARERPDLLNNRRGLDCLHFEGEIPETNIYLKKTIVEHGVTGRIAFDENGRRSGYSLTILEQTPVALQKVGTWSEAYELQLTPEFSRQSTLPTYSAFRNDPPIRVTSIEEWPYLKQKDDGTFEGFTVDFLDEMSTVLGRSFQLSLVKDSMYGIKKNGEWRGMVGELVRKEADIVVASLTKTREREEVIDFSKVFMTVGLNILMKKPDLEPVATGFGPFSFFTVWSVEIWMLILLYVAVFSAACYAISRFTGIPDRVRALESKKNDNLSPCGSFWFTAGSLFFRDTGIYPRTISHRVWAMLWWAFCLFVVMMYISSLSAALVKARTTVTTIHSRKSSHEVLKDFLDTGFPSVGTLKSGSTNAFFMNSEIGLYKDYGQLIKDTPELLTNSYREGVERVKNSGGSYAFIMESSGSQLYASQNCDLVVSSGFLATRPYAVALQKDSPLREDIDHAVLSVIETGTLRRLYEKWWFNISSTCEDPTLNILPKIYNTSMTLYEVSGIFYLLILFTLLSIAAAAIEHYFRTKGISME